MHFFAASLDHYDHEEGQRELCEVKAQFKTSQSVVSEGQKGHNRCLCLQLKEKEKTRLEQLNKRDTAKMESNKRRAAREKDEHAAALLIAQKVAKGEEVCIVS